MVEKLLLILKNASYFSTILIEGFKLILDLVNSDSDGSGSISSNSELSIMS